MGRGAELTRLRRGAGRRSTRRVFLVYGDGGIGKSTLLHEFRRARGRGRPALLLDGRELDPSPDGLQAAEAQALPSGYARPQDLPGLAYWSTPTSTWRRSTAWFRPQFLPDLPADGLTVLAGRDVPSLPGGVSAVATVRRSL